MVKVDREALAVLDKGIRRTNFKSADRIAGINLSSANVSIMPTREETD